MNPKEDFKTFKKVVVLSPYANMSKEVSQEIVERNKTYAKLLYSFCCLRLQHQPIMPHLEYMHLPDSYLAPEGFTQDELNRSCSFYPGKTSSWRDYSSWTDEAENYIVGIDYGISKGMEKLILERKANIIFVTIRGLKSVCQPGCEEQDFFDKYQPEPLPNTAAVVDLVEMKFV
jgi:hypothetical protein